MDQANVSEPILSQEQDAVAKEGKRLLRLALAVGIQPEVLRLSKLTLESMLDVPFYSGTKASAADIFPYLYSKKWLGTGQFIVVEGGGRFQRQAVAQRVFFQAILSTSSDVNPPVFVEACDLLLRFNGFDKKRLNVIDQLRSSSCLYLAEIDKDMSPNPASDAPLMLESLFSHRLRNRLPTIFSVTEPLDDYHWVGWGRTVLSTMDNGKKHWPAPSTSFYRVRIKDGDMEEES